MLLTAEIDCYMYLSILKLARKKHKVKKSHSFIACYIFGGVTAQVLHN